MSDGDKADESEDEEPAMPWRGMSAELAALSTPGSIHARSHGDSDNASESGESSDAVSTVAGLLRLCEVLHICYACPHVIALCQ